MALKLSFFVCPSEWKPTQNDLFSDLGGQWITHKKILSFCTQCWTYSLPFSCWFPSSCTVRVQSTGYALVARGSNSVSSPGFRSCRRMRCEIAEVQWERNLECVPKLLHPILRRLEKGPVVFADVLEFLCSVMRDKILHLQIRFPIPSFTETQCKAWKWRSSNWFRLIGA